MSLVLALVAEVPIAIILSAWGVEPFARYLSNSIEVALLTAQMWRSINWCYLFYAASTQLVTVLLATNPS